jgi:Ras-related protein Rab-6A
MAQPVGTYTNPLKKFKLVFLGEQSGTRTTQFNRQPNAFRTEPIS